MKHNLWGFREISDTDHEIWLAETSMSQGYSSKQKQTNSTKWIIAGYETKREYFILIDRIATASPIMSWPLSGWVL